MKKNCNIIKDLLPLYIDDVCSKESKHLVEEHLKGCNNCQKYLDASKFNIKESKVNDVNAFKKFAKKINLKIISYTILITCFIFTITIFIIKNIINYKFTLEYHDNMYLALNELDNRWNFSLHANISGIDYGTVIHTKENDENINLIFITRKYQLQDYFESKKGIIHSSVPEIDYTNINPKEKMKVYYTIEDLNNIKDANEEKLKNIIDNSTLIFTNNKTTSSITCKLNNKEYMYTLTYYSTNKQIVESINDENMPNDLLKTIYSIHGEYKSVWFFEDKAPDIFKKIEKYMTDNGGSCSRENNK